MGEVANERTSIDSWLEDGEINIREKHKDNERKGRHRGREKRS